MRMFALAAGLLAALCCAVTLAAAPASAQAQSQAQSRAECDWTNYAALSLAETRLAKGSQWRGNLEQEQTFLKPYYQYGFQELRRFGKKELQAFAGSPTEVEKRMRQAGFELRHSSPQASFATGAILNWQGQWLAKGAAETIHSDDRAYAGVLLQAGVTCLAIPDSKEPLVEIATKSGDFVYLSKTTDTREDLLVQATALYNRVNGNERKAHPRYRGVIFPKIALNFQTRLSLLEGISAPGKDGEPLILQEALQQIKFQLDENGAAAKSGSALYFGKGVVEPFRLDDDFLAFVIRPGLSEPILAVYCDQDAWIAK